MRRLLALVVAISLGSACGDEATKQTTTLDVFAASSLANAFDDIAAAFEAEHEGVDVVISPGASSALREQILAGSPADVFASANASNIDAVIDAREADDSTPFVTNVLEIVVPAGNPGDVTGLEDFAKDDLLIGLCAEEVPCGEFGREVLAKAAVTPSIDTNEPDARSLLAKVEADDLDAGLVYHTDVLSSDAVEGIEVPADVNVTATYPIAALSGADDRDLAEAFVAFVLSDEGQAVLASYGFASVP